MKKEIRTRFAPSPTGHLHIGGARTALYNYLFAKSQGGKVILRIEDTDQERGSYEFEQSQIADLAWLGITFDESPQNPGAHSPYRQSERLSIYQEVANQLMQEEKAYFCFCSEAVLEEKKERHLREGLPPHYDGTCRHLSPSEVANQLHLGGKPVVRMKAPVKSYSFQDRVRDRVIFPENMVGDFVIMRSGGFPVYNFCCVVDDIQMEITHVIRGDEHLSNTLRQLMIYEALGKTPPEFAHVSLLVGKDRQKLSKRHGATSVENYKQMSYLPSALLNYLVQLGWSHPQEKDVFTMESIIPLFNLERFSKSPAMFDVDKLNFINGQHLKLMDNHSLLKQVEPYFAPGHEFFNHPVEWKISVVNMLKNQIQFFSEFSKLFDETFNFNQEDSEVANAIRSQEFFPKIKEKVHGFLQQIMNAKKEALTQEDVVALMDLLKKELGIKGKDLFMGVRVALTGKSHGPELKDFLPLVNIAKLAEMTC